MPLGVSFQNFSSEIWCYSLYIVCPILYSSAIKISPVSLRHLILSHECPLPTSVKQFKWEKLKNESVLKSLKWKVMSDLSEIWAGWTPELFCFLKTSGVWLVEQNHNRKNSTVSCLIVDIYSEKSKKKRRCRVYYSNMVKILVLVMLVVCMVVDPGCAGVCVIRMCSWMEANDACGNYCCVPVICEDQG